MSADPPLLVAQRLHQAKRLPEAEALCRQILAVTPNHAEALYLLGLIALDSGAYQPALSLIQRSIALSSHASYLMYYHLGYAQQIVGQDREALTSYDEALKIEPHYANAYANKGILLRRLGADYEAMRAYIRALELAPNMAGTYYNLANALRDNGQTLQAVANFEKALALLGTTGSPANIQLQAAIHNNLGQVYADGGQHKQATEHFHQSIKLMPDGCETYHNYGNILREQGKWEEALVLYEKALTLKPLYPEVRLAYAMAHIPLLFDKESEIDPSRHRFEQELDRLEKWFDADRIELGHLAVGVSQPFYIAYQERNNQPLLSKYGRLCTRLMLDWANKHPMPQSPALPSKMVRIGIVSSHFHDHSVWHALIKGWLRHFDRNQIEMHIFYVNHLVDVETRWAQANTSSFQNLSMNLDVAVRSILAKQLDILIYPEIGMAPTALKLASLRLCPIQITSWGHPETSGLPTMDYYLSAEDFEPPEADAYYAEKLIRLPHLGCCYQPLQIPDQPLNLLSLGIKPDLPIILSPGMTFKYAAAHDQVFVDIVKRLGPCQIIFFIGRFDVLTEKFRDRLSKVFKEAGLDYNTSCLFIPWQDRASFYSLLKQATVFLDTIGFSGFNTAIQAIECGLPIVTREGRFMRGRLASGILRRMELQELITSNDATYVDKVVELVTNTPYRTSIRDKIIERRERLFEDRTPVEALQKLLIGLAGKA